MISLEQIINGAAVASVNPATLRNPECLVAYESIGKVLRAEVAYTLDHRLNGYLNGSHILWG